MSEKIERAVRGLDIKVVFLTNQIVRRQLSKMKTSRHKHETKGVVHFIRCECGCVYIGETGRTLKQRITEHKRAVKHQDKNNGIAVHVQSIKHEIIWEEETVLCTVQHWTKRKMNKTLHITASTHFMNLDSKITMDSGWDIV